MSEQANQPSSVPLPEPGQVYLPVAPQLPPPAGKKGRTFTEKQVLLLGGIVGGFALVLLLLAIYFLTLPATDTAKVRDVFIVVLALEAIVIGVSVIVMMVQLARLLNLVQNEIRPMLEATETTLNNLRGTTEFLTENMVEPVMKLNESAAAIRSLLVTLRLFRR